MPDNPQENKDVVSEGSNQDNLIVEETKSEFQANKSYGDANLQAGVLLEAVHFFGLPTGFEVKTKEGGEKENVLRHGAYNQLIDGNNQITAAGKLYLDARDTVISKLKDDPNNPSGAITAAINQIVEDSEVAKNFKERLKNLDGASMNRVVSSAKFTSLQDSGFAKEYEAAKKKGVLESIDPFAKEYSSKGMNEVGENADLKPSWNANGTRFTMVLRSAKDGRYFADQILERNNYDYVAKYDFTVPRYTIKRSGQEPNTKIRWDAVDGVLSRAQEHNCYNFTLDIDGRKCYDIGSLLDLSDKDKGKEDSLIVPGKRSVYLTKDSSSMHNADLRAFQRCAERQYLNEVNSFVMKEKLSAIQNDEAWGSEVFNPRDPVALHAEMLLSIDKPAEERIKSLNDRLADPKNTEAQSKELREKIEETKALRDLAKARLKKDLTKKPALNSSVRQNIIDRVESIESAVWKLNEARARITVLEATLSSQKGDLAKLKPDGKGGVRVSEEAKELADEDIKFKQKTIESIVFDATGEKIELGKQPTTATGDAGAAVGAETESDVSTSDKPTDSKTEAEKVKKQIKESLDTIDKLVESKKAEIEGLSEYTGDREKTRRFGRQLSGAFLKNGILVDRYSSMLKKEDMMSILKGPSEPGREAFTPNIGIDDYRKKIKEKILNQVKGDDPIIGNPARIEKFKAEEREEAIKEERAKYPILKSTSISGKVMQGMGMGVSKQDIAQSEAKLKARIESKEFDDDLTKRIDKKLEAREAICEHVAETSTRRHLHSARGMLETSYRQDLLNSEVTKIYLDIAAAQIKKVDKATKEEFKKIYAGDFNVNVKVAELMKGNEGLVDAEQIDKARSIARDIVESKVSEAIKNKSLSLDSSNPIPVEESRQRLDDFGALGSKVSPLMASSNDFLATKNVVERPPKLPKNDEIIKPDEGKGSVDFSPHT